MGIKRPPLFSNCISHSSDYKLTTVSTQIFKTFQIKFKMFKLLVLSVFLAVAAAAPSGLYHDAPIAYESVVSIEPEYHVGHVVEHIPTAVSHQSRTDYHSKPVVHSVLAPVVHAAPIVHAAPVLHAAPIAYSAPILSHSYAQTYAHSAPLIHSW